MAKTEPEPTVLVVDDDPMVLKALTKTVKTLRLAVETYASADEFRKADPPTGPACLVLDVRLPGRGGLDLQQDLAAAGSTLPIIFITGHADVRMAVQAMERGAFAFLEKPFRMQELCDKIQQAIALDQQRWQERRQRATHQRKLSRLTPAERQVADKVAAGQTNRMIAAELGVSVRTIEVHRARLMKKLAVKSRAALVKLLASAGGP